MSDKNVQQLQWKSKNPEKTIYVSRNVDIQQDVPIAPGTSSVLVSPSAPTPGIGANGRYSIIVSGSQSIRNPTPAPTHFHHMQSTQVQQQPSPSLPQQQQQHHHIVSPLPPPAPRPPHLSHPSRLHNPIHHHHHQQTQHFELPKIMGVSSRIDIPSAHGAPPISSSITENVLSLIGAPSSAGPNKTGIATRIPDEEKLKRVQAVVEAGVSKYARQEIVHILEKVSTLKPVERLLLYLRLPGETPQPDPLRQPQNPLGTRSEITHTINWIRSHLERDSKVSIPKKDVYDDYIAYCGRSDIKPLSTADFGKVMKQVFPDLRPRRLGTRGNSRYCYAAMRKTTKLPPPEVPVVGGELENVLGIEDESLADIDSWTTVRKWAEGILNTKFETIKELAGHIEKNEQAGASTSRVLLQKKLLQKNAKEKRVYADSGPLKKRQKKKRKGSTSSESSSTQPSISSVTSSEPSRSADTIRLRSHTNKLEIHTSTTTQSRTIAPLQINYQTTTPSFDTHMPEQQLLPINLATETDRNRPNSVLPSTSTLSETLTKTIANLSPSVTILPIDPHIAQKDKIPNDEYNPQNVICKKVRRAHLTKGILASTSRPPSAISMSVGTTIGVQPIELSVATACSYSMGPPAQITPSNTELPKITSQVRAKKQRLLEAHTETFQAAFEQTQNQQPQQQTHQQPPQSSPQQVPAIRQPSPLVDNVEISEDKDVLPENLGLPRERVISICNMDKHELDDYLNTNDDDNSQDQEAELLQYFQMGDAENNNNNNININNKTIQNLDNIDAHDPTLLQVNCGSAIETANKKRTTVSLGISYGGSTKQRDDITQLRNYLHQNFNKDSTEPTEAATQVSSKVTIQGPKFMSTGNQILPSTYNNEGSSSASQITLSQKHLTEMPLPCGRLSTLPASTVASSKMPITISATPTNTTIIPTESYTFTSNNVRTSQKRKINLNAIVPAPNTTQRRRNCTFSPISPNINMPSSGQITGLSTSSITITPNPNIFASPKSTTTAIRTKPVLHKQISLPLSTDIIITGHDPMIGANRNTRTYSAMASASAPPSPSIMQNSMVFNKTCNVVGGNPVAGGYTSVMPQPDYQLSYPNSCDANKMIIGDQNSLDYSLEEPPMHLISESRSRSVPLQYRNSPVFNQTASQVGEFSSTCNSAAQTPVPSQFADFNDASSILNIFSETNQNHESTMKIDETTGSILSASVIDILSPDYERMTNTFPAIVSRSVPSTPLPLRSLVDPFLGNKKLHHEQQQDNHHSAINKYPTKLIDISKSMPTTPIASKAAASSFRYSPEFNRDFLINGNTIENTSAYSRTSSVTTATDSGLPDSLLDDTRNGGSNSLTEGIDDLTTFAEVSESIIGADILNINNL